MTPHILKLVILTIFKQAHFSDKITTNTGAPQGCVLSPVLFTIYTNDCVSENKIQVCLLKFADDSTIQGFIVNDDEIVYRRKIQNFVVWCDVHFLDQNVSKQKKLFLILESVIRNILLLL